jgi:hypothetical protein
VHSLFILAWVLYQSKGHETKNTTTKNNNENNSFNIVLLCKLYGDKGDATSSKQSAPTLFAGIIYLVLY